MKTKLIILLIFITLAGAAGWFALKKFGAPVRSMVPQTILAAAQKKAVRNSVSIDLPRFESALMERLHELEISSASCTIRKTDSSTTIQTAFPRGKPVEWLIWYVSQATSGNPYSLADCLFNEKTESGYILFTSNRKSDRPVRLTFKMSNRFLSTSARIALIVTMDTPEAFAELMNLCAIPAPLSFALVPGDSQADGAARIAAAHHKETLIYLPMESNRKVSSRYSGWLILVHYTAERISTIIANAQKELPGSAGIINLFGSRACEDSRIMNIVLTEAKKQRLYFIDSRATPRSVSGIVAHALKVPFGRIDASIESTSPAEIVRELDVCALNAQRNGELTVLCRGNSALVSALKKELPRLKQNGVVTVFASTLCTTNKNQP